MVTMIEYMPLIDIELRHTGDESSAMPFMLQWSVSVIKNNSPNDIGDRFSNITHMCRTWILSFVNQIEC